MKALADLGSLAHQQYEEYIWYTYLTPLHAQWALYASIAVFGVFVIGFWQQYFRSKHSWLRLEQSALLTLTIPAALIAVVHFSKSFEGLPDERCHRYGNGDALFTLVKGPWVFPASASEPMGEKELWILVRQLDRFGDKPHLCVMSVDDPRAQILAKRMKEAMEERLEYEGEERTIGANAIVFSFNGYVERTNITWRGQEHPPDKGPPDEPPQEL